MLAHKWSMDACGYARVGLADGAMLSNVKLSVPATSDSERASLVELSKHDVEQARIRAMQRAGTVMLASTALLLVLVLGLLITLAAGMANLNSHLRTISDTLSPATVSAAVGSVTHSLDNVAKSSDNVLMLSGDAGTVGERLVEAANQTVTLLHTANAMASSLMAHPTLTIGQAPAT